MKRYVCNDNKVRYIISKRRSLVSVLLPLPPISRSAHVKAISDTLVITSQYNNSPAYAIEEKLKAKFKCLVSKINISGRINGML